MSVRALCLEPEPILRQHARAVTDFSAALRALAQDLIETMHDSDGVGLAAPQVGVDLQLCVANPTQEAGRELVLANPVIESATGRARVTEGCLSLPNVWERIGRAARIRLRGQDLSGRAVQIDAEGLLAIVLQHEVDHLRGHLFVDYLPWYHRRRLKAWWAGVRCGQPLAAHAQRHARA